MNTSRKRFALVAGTLAAVLVGGGVAVAYWTASGSGTGTAGVGTDSGVTVVQDSTVTGLFPGGPAQGLDFTVTNTSATTSVQISSVVIGFGAGFAAGCSAADFTLTQPSKPSVGTPLTIPAGGSLSFTSGGAGPTGATGAAIAMVNSASNQNACKSSTVPLTYTVS